MNLLSVIPRNQKIVQFIKTTVGCYVPHRSHRRFVPDNRLFPGDIAFYLHFNQ